MFPILIFLFTVIPALEIYLLFKIGAQFGGLNTISLVIITGVIGASLAKSQGLTILNKIQIEVNRGELPGREIIHGLMVFAGGLLLLTPGILTDIFGFSLVMPGPRHVLYLWVKKLVDKMVQNGHFKVKTFNSEGGFYTSSTSYTSTRDTNESFFTQEKKGTQEIAPGVFEADYRKKED